MLDTKVLSQKLAALRAERNIAGMTVAVTDSKGVVYMEAFGVDNMDRPHVPAEPDSVFRIASVTKMFTGSLIMKLQEQGKIDLNAPAKTYLPWLKLRRSAATEQMTVRH
ncbi:MAG: beta-lactamase family protein, partial [Clostridia bacterium]|nr:beta-lactamase family protein [Clostridia bacterium]